VLLPPLVPGPFVLPHLLLVLAVRPVAFLACISALRPGRALPLAPGSPPLLMGALNALLAPLLLVVVMTLPALLPPLPLPLLPLSLLGAARAGVVPSLALAVLLGLTPRLG
jgi:hypothetical protein